MVHGSSVRLSQKDIGKSGQLEKVVRYDEGAVALQGAHTSLGEQHNDIIWQKSLECAYLPPTYQQFLQFHRYLCGFHEHMKMSDPSNSCVPKWSSVSESGELK